MSAGTSDGSDLAAAPSAEAERAISLAIPLEHQLSAKFDSVLTPSGQVSDMAAVAGVELPPEQAVAEYEGELTP